MAFFSNARETSGRYGGYIAEFQDLFGRHEVKCGKPADFLQLTPKLAYDEQFRVDFTRLTKSVGQREEGRLTLTRILTIIAIASGGYEIESLEKNAVAISLVVVFLAGVGGWCETEPKDGTARVMESEGVTTKVVMQPEAPVRVQPEAPVRVEPEVTVKVEPEVTARVESVAARVGQGSSKREEPKGWGAVVAAVNSGSQNEDEVREALELERRLAAGPQNDRGEMNTSPFGGPAVKQALNRLELNTLELKLHLDSIDHRMERIEPHLDDLAARIGPTVESLPLPEKNGWPKGLPMHRFSPQEIAEPHAVEQSIVELEADATKVDEASPPVVSQPERTERSRRFYLVVALVLLLVLAGAVGVFFYGRHGGGPGKSQIAGAAGVGSQPSATDTMHGLDPPGRGGGNGAAGPGPVRLGDKEGNGRQPEKQNLPVQAGQGGQGSTGGVVTGPDRIGPNRTGQNLTAPGNRPGTEVRTEFGNRPGKIHIAKEVTPPPTMVSNAHMVASLPGAVASARMPSVGRLPPPPEASAAAAKTADAPASGSASLVFVPASALTHNLIASPKPTYPPVAHFQRTEGDVMVRAVISAQGVVEIAAAMSGPASLREAAVEAMRNWRYRPYLVNGKPVVVQTYINFHFSLEH